MAKAKANNRPLIKTCGDFDVYGQLDYPPPVNQFPKNKVCHLPQITMLNELHDEHPDATFILNFRNISHWTRSVARWRGLPKRLAACQSGPADDSDYSLQLC
jgi:Sulfotransferase domain